MLRDLHQNMNTWYHDHPENHLEVSESPLVLQATLNKHPILKAAASPNVAVIAVSPLRYGKCILETCLQLSSLAD